MYAIAIHGAQVQCAGDAVGAARAALSRRLEAALDGGFALLARGGSSLDAVSAAVRILEDDPSFNAGHGAALTRDGAAEPRRRDHGRQAAARRRGRLGAAREKSIELARG